jgi:hypothetical protein
VDDRPLEQKKPDPVIPEDDSPPLLARMDDRGAGTPSSAGIVFEPALAGSRHVTVRLSRAAAGNAPRPPAKSGGAA